MDIVVDKDGWITGDPQIKKESRPLIEHGEMKVVRGIIVHQTDSADAKSTLASYQRAGANGAHFLIDKDGTTYQVSSVYKKTWHVGRLRMKCLETHTCTAAEIKASTPFNPKVIHSIEMKKSVPLRFPSNEDSVGIELVALCKLDPKYIKPGMTSEDVKRLTALLGVYERVTPAQNLSLQSLVVKIQSLLSVTKDQVFPHTEVSNKNPTEGTTAQWSAEK